MAFQKGNTFVFGETPSASKWDQLWRNDDALADGSGFDEGAIGTDALAQSAVTGDAIAWNTVTQELSYSSSATPAAFGSLYYRDYAAQSWPTPFTKLYGVSVIYSTTSGRQFWIGGIIADENGVNDVREYRPTSTTVTSNFKIIGFGKI